MPGRAYLELREESIPWNIIEYVHATVKYVDNNADPNQLEKVLVMNEESDSVFFNEVIWKERSEPFQLSITYNYKNGNKETRDVIVEGDLHVVESPIERWLDIPVIARYVNDEWERGSGPVPI